MKKIILKGKYGFGKHALVDDGDYEKVIGFSWRVDKYGYVVSSYWNKKDISISMHRLILDGKALKMDIDHANHDKLDNRKDNLRICTRSQNQANRIKKPNTTSIYKGVSFEKRSSKWRAVITVQGKFKSLGFFQNQIDAAIAYNNKAKEVFGQFAHINLI